MFQLIAEWQNPDALVREAARLLANTGDVLVAVVDLEAFNRSQETHVPFDVLGSHSDENTTTVAAWIWEVQQAAYGGPLRVANFRMRLAPPIVVLGRKTITHTEVQNLLSVGATYVVKPEDYEDSASWKSRERLLRHRRLLLDLSNLYEPAAHEVIDPDLEDNDFDIRFEDEDRVPEDVETSMADGEVNALEIFSNSSLGLSAVDFSRLFAVARGYEDNVAQPYAEPEG